MLPVDVLHAICSFLTGFDVFYFSHTNSWTLNVLSDNLYWQKRITSDTEDHNGSWKQRYMKERSLLFVDPQSASSYIHGMLLGRNRSRLSFAKFERPSVVGKWRGDRVDLGAVNDKSFSIDVWFCLFPGTHQQPVGGVIYGLQSEPAIDRSPAENSGHFVMVDMKRNLHCSVLNEQKVVARDLKLNYWYHLALTYNVELQRQQVYINGNIVSTDFGPLNYRWPRLKYEQIGTGYCDNTARARDIQLPHARHRGDWYSFYGLIDEFRIWEGALPTEAVANLSCCRQPEKCSLIGTIKRYHDRRGPWINTHSVRCTRPAEGKNVVVNQS